MILEAIFEVDTSGFEHLKRIQATGQNGGLRCAMIHVSYLETPTSKPGIVRYQPSILCKYFEVCKDSRLIPLQ